MNAHDRQVIARQLTLIEHMQGFFEASATGAASKAEELKLAVSDLKAKLTEDVVVEDTSIRGRFRKAPVQPQVKVRVAQFLHEGDVYVDILLNDFPGPVRMKAGDEIVLDPNTGEVTYG